MTEPNEVKLTWSEFKETMEKHSCLHCLFGIMKNNPCKDACVDCYIDYIKEWDKTKEDIKS